MPDTRTQSLRINFTTKTLAAIAPPAQGRVVFHDLRTPDLSLRVDSNGRRTFFWFRTVAGKPTFKPLGTFPTTAIEEARAAAQQLSVDLERFRRDPEGPNPFEGHSATPTLSELFEAYISRHLLKEAKRPAEAETRARYLFQYLACWRKRRISQITRREVIELHEEVGEAHGRVVGNRVVQLLSTLYSFAERKDIWDGKAPTSKFSLFKEASRDRYLQRDEVPRLFKALKDAPPDLRDFTLLALFTGARKSDVWAMAWSDLRLDGPRPTWEIPDPKVEAYTANLHPAAVAILIHRKAECQDSPWVFPARSRSGHREDLKYYWRPLLERAGIKDFRIHDLRRSLASWEARQGTSLLLIAKSLGHKSTAATGRYARLQDAELARPSVESAVDALLLAAGQDDDQSK